MRFVLITFGALLLLMEAQALSMASHYKYDQIICLLLLVFMYRIRTRIFLYWLHYFLFGLFLVMHGLGMYQLYESYPLGVEYDYWVHGYFGLVFSLILSRMFVAKGMSIWSAMPLTIVSVLGVSAAHELYEYAGALLLGQGEGVLFIGAGDLDEWDTQKDMLNNLIGGLLGLLAFVIAKKYTDS